MTEQPTSRPDASVLIVGVGAARGLGAAIARRFAKGGYAVALAGRNEVKLRATAEALLVETPHVTWAVGDAARAEDARRFVAKAEELAPLALAVQNAGSNNPVPFLETDQAHFEGHWREHSLSAFHLAQAALPLMLARGSGTLIFTGASASLRGKARFGSFAAAKAGMRMLSQSLAREFGKQGIHVANVVIDGGIEGDRLLSRHPHLEQQSGADGLLNIDAIADAYWMLHHQHRSAWTEELDLRPWAEVF